MKFYLISDDKDALTGMHLAGIKGEFVGSAEEARAAIMRMADNPEIGILLITDSIACACPETVSEMKLGRKEPLLVEIPNSDGSARPADSIVRIVHEAIGM